MQKSFQDAIHYKEMKQKRKKFILSQTFQQLHIARKSMQCIKVIKTVHCSLHWGMGEERELQENKEHTVISPAV